MRAAAIGIGSNSLRLLVADRNGGQITTVLRKRLGLRVFAALNRQGEIAPAMLQQACDSVNLLRQAACDAGAVSIHLFATSAVRDAKNQQALAGLLLDQTGLRLEVISGETEAKLSFIGATDDVRSGMIDIGGGSTEIAIGRRDQLEFTHSLQAGAVRLYRDYPVAGIEDIPRVKQAVHALFTPYLPALAQIKTPTAWVGVGGTLTALASCVQQIGWDDHEHIDGFVAMAADVRRVMYELAAIPIKRRQQLPYVPPDRADILVHGFVILLACMETLHIQCITVSRRTNLDGYLKLMPAGELE